jgi:hypothetical protein
MCENGISAGLDLAVGTDCRFPVAVIVLRIGQHLVDHGPQEGIVGQCRRVCSASPDSCCPVASLPSNSALLERHWNGMGTQTCSMHGYCCLGNAQSAHHSTPVSSALERHGNGLPVSWSRVYWFTGNRGRRRHAGGSVSSLRRCPGAGSRPHANKRGTAWLAVELDRDGRRQREPLRMHDPEVGQGGLLNGQRNPWQITLARAMRVGRSSERGVEYRTRPALELKQLRPFCDRPRLHR